MKFKRSPEHTLPRRHVFRINICQPLIDIKQQIQWYRAYFFECFHNYWFTIGYIDAVREGTAPWTHLGLYSLSRVLLIRSTHRIFTLSWSDAILEAALLVGVVGLTRCRGWIHKLLLGWDVIQAGAHTWAKTHRTREEKRKHTLPGNEGFWKE